LAAKPRSKKTDRAADATRSRATRWLLQCAALLLLVTGLLASIIWLGRWSQQQVRSQDRYLVPVADIECDPPAGLDRVEFLDQVRYDARLPAQVNVLDDDLPAQLRAAFAKHPWVETVDDVQLRSPRTITVRLTYRTPVLAVPWDGGLRAVDGYGVLLPRNAPTRELPVYDGEPKAPRGPAGTRWGDPDDEARARALRP
jgi:cell division septal protein FtsQ